MLRQVNHISGFALCFAFVLQLIADLSECVSAKNILQCHCICCRLLCAVVYLSPLCMVLDCTKS